MAKKKYISKPDHYVNNALFYDQICKWINKRNRNKKKYIPVNAFIGEQIYKIVHRFSYRPNFINYTYKDKLISEALYTCIRYAHKFKPEKSKNPFAYFTTIAWSSFIKCINEEKKASNIKKKIYDTMAHKMVKFKNNNYNDLRDLDGEEEWNPLTITIKNKSRIFKTKESYEKYNEKKKKKK